MKSLFKKLKNWVIDLFSTKEERLFRRLNQNKLRIIDLMNIKYDGEKGLNDKTVKVLNDIFRGNDIQVKSLKPVGAHRIAEMMYYNKHDEVRLNETTIKGLNDLFANADDSSDDYVKRNRDLFNQYVLGK